ncbi:MAG: hypothetical protein ACE3JQ_03640 [Paenisporosarcina sp.]
MNKAVVIIVGILLSLGLLLIGFFISYDQINEKELFVFSQTKAEQVTKVEKTVKPIEKKDTQLDSLPHAEEEATRWNATATDFIAMYEDFKYDPNDITKDETNSNDEQTTFIHEFKTAVKIRLVYTVNNETKEITGMKLIGFDTGPDRAAIFHAMSMFISYVDSETTITQAGEYLGEIPFGNDKDGLYEVQFNGKSYDYEVNHKEGTNTLIYRIE